MLGSGPPRVIQHPPSWIFPPGNYTQPKDVQRRDGIGKGMKGMQIETFSCINWQPLNMIREIRRGLVQSRIGRKWERGAPYKNGGSIISFRAGSVGVFMWREHRKSDSDKWKRVFNWFNLQVVLIATNRSIIKENCCSLVPGCHSYSNITLSSLIRGIKVFQLFH